MYCKFCGTVVDEGARFCQACGKNLTDSAVNTSAEIKQESTSNTMPSKSYGTLVSALTLPILFIIRMLTQTSESVSAGTYGAWRDYSYVSVPGNIKAIMFMLLAASALYSIFTIKEKKQLVILPFVALNVLLGITIIMVQVPQ